MGDKSPLMELQETIVETDFTDRVEEVEIKVDHDTFTQLIIPFAIGYMSMEGYGLTDITHHDSVLVFTRVEQEEE